MVPTSSIVKSIWALWGIPHINLFVTRDNCKLPTFVSPFPDGGAWATDAMFFSWKGMWTYAFRLVPKVLAKMREQQVEIVLVTPWWPKRVWSLDLCITRSPTRYPRMSVTSPVKETDMCMHSNSHIVTARGTNPMTGSPEDT